MTEPSTHPAFGTADLTNCERELIHLAGSIQQHGVLLVLEEPSLKILQVGGNARALLGSAPEQLLGRTLAEVSPELEADLRQVLDAAQTGLPVPFSHRRKAPAEDELEGMVHRTERQGLLLELERWTGPEKDAVGALGDALPARLRDIIAQITTATSIESLCELIAHELRQLIGYDRVMVYRFDPDGHGEVVAEARDPELDSYLGLHYPASDIPQRARELYLRTRVRVLADVRYTPAPLVPRLSPMTGTELDMSLSYLRSMSPLHLQYLQNMGVTATLVTSLVKDGRLWGLIACHHYSPRRMPYEMRAGCELLSEVFSTRLAALDAQAGAQAELLIRRLEQQIMEAVSISGEWHQALFEVVRAVLQPLGATGGALLYEGQTLTAGVVPSTEELTRLVGWVAEQDSGSLFQSSTIGRLEPSFAKLAHVASGTLAIRLTASRLDYLIWFRKEQIQTVRWAGDPRKPVLGDDPLHLSPRRSFAEWTEQVRGTAKPWGEREIAIARMLQASLADSIQQVQAVRVLFAARQLSAVSRVAERSGEPMVILDARDRVLLVNNAFRRLVGADAPVGSLEDLAAQFSDSPRLLEVVERVRRDQLPWAGELAVLSRGQPVPMAVRADAVPAVEGGLLGTLLLLTDLRERREAEAVRRRLSRTIAAGGAEEGSSPGESAEFGQVMDAVLTNARLAVTSISGAGEEAHHPVALRSIESLTRRAAELARQMLSFASRSPRTD